jgi:type VI secretion system protein ImpH
MARRGGYVPHAIGPEGLLARDTRRFGFFQALRLIEAAHRDRPRLGCSLHPREDAVRLGQSPRLGFVAAELDAYQAAGDEGPARLSVNVGGLFGANGPMPLHLTEYVHDRISHAGDTTLAAFADVFHHRQLCLFYRAWAAGQPVVGLDPDRPGASGYGFYAASLCGWSGAGAVGPRAADVLGKLQFCGLLSTRTRHASGLGLLLGQYFGVPMKIRQFVGLWLRLGADDCTRLGTGAPHHSLGLGLVVGKRVWDRQSKFRVVIGPVGSRDMRRLLPGTASHGRLVDWVHLYTGGLLEWDIELRLTHEAAACMRLDGHARLAYTTWLGRRTAGAPPTVRIQPRQNTFTTR